jgi:TonB-linked SusC/RagA family outer membrane protein
MRKILPITAALMLCAALVFSQAKNITGQVKDAQGNPVSYATITNKRTNAGVAADANGSFSISAETGDSLVVTATSFQTFSVAVGSSPTITIALQPQTGLQEVVVTALGIRRTRNTVPYAAQQIAGDEVSKNRTSNFVQNMSGKISGLEIRQSNTLGGSTNVIVRGSKSLTGDNQALFVVDGVPYNNSNTNTAGQRTGGGGFDYGNASADINPDDIESVTVLKGAAASALYGSIGANGVILITTKKGKRGLGITVNSGITVGKVDKSTFAKYQKEYGGGYGAFYGPNEDQYFNELDVNGDGTPDLVAPVHEDASYGGKFDPNLLVYQWNAFDPTSPYYKKARPWVGADNDPSDIFETPISSNQSVFIDGGSDRGTFKIGYTRNDDKGILPNSYIKKNLLNLASTYNITPALTASGTLNFSNIQGKGRFGTGYDDKNLMTNFRQWWQTNVDVKEQKDAYFRTGNNITWNMKAGDPFAIVPNFWDNPYFSRYENYESDERYRYFGNASLNYKITDWINILGRASLDSYNELQEERQALGSVTVSSYRRFNRSYREHNFDLLANIDKNITDDLNFKALVGTNLRRQNTKFVRASTNGGLIVSKVYSLSNSLNTPNAPTEYDFTREVLGVFGGITLSWKDMLTLDGTLRRDKSSTLPKSNNTYYYPAVSGGFVFSKLVPEAGWLSYGKLRANYAEVGNDAQDLLVTDVYNLLPPLGSDPQASVPATKNNPDLKPERTKSYEAGIEASFAQSRIGFDVTYYSAKSTNQIVPAVVSTATGYDAKIVNAGTIQNKGVEVSVYGTPIKTKDFSWTVNVNWTRNKNKVLELFEGSENLVLANFQGGITLNATLGQPYGTIRGNDYVYTNGEKTVGANGRYLVSPTANEVIGNPNPDWIGGVNNNFKYKDFTLSFLVDTRQGGDVFSLDMYYGLATGLYPETAGLNDLGNPSRMPRAQGGGVIMPGVKGDGKPNDIRVTNNYGTYGYVRNPNKAFVYDASFVKLREAAIAYSLPTKLISGLKVFKGIDLSLVGRNLWIIHKNLPYADPEENISSGNLQGYQSGAYPTTRTFTFNIKFRF